ncbi:hypothetical protein PMZ80_005757 [Knufia obscura]|uniref:Uncharacterized protein n=2 Tax=Knufia TaxID=430999 RepID=A0AAN8EFJ6_9EURO|nr:hypothetical protein PMZ80_005757 [Knufia obscura]KAK5954423.1 hypothetical protein OHC33_004145 [Knufia fluminis]
MADSTKTSAGMGRVVPIEGYTAPTDSQEQNTEKRRRMEKLGAIRSTRVEKYKTARPRLTTEEVRRKYGLPHRKRRAPLSPDRLMDWAPSETLEHAGWSDLESPPVGQWNTHVDGRTFADLATSHERRAHVSLPTIEEEPEPTSEPTSTVITTPSTSAKNQDETSDEDTARLLRGLNINSTSPYELFTNHMRPWFEVGYPDPEQLQDRIDEEWRKLSNDLRLLWQKRYEKHVRGYDA